MAGKPFFVVPLPLETITAGNALANRPVTNLGEFAYRGMVWETADNTNLWVKADVASPRTIGFVSVMNANAQAGTTIRVRLGDTEAAVNGSGAPFDSGVVPFINPSISYPPYLYHSHTEIQPHQSRRWIRVDIGGHTGPFTASMLVIGERFTPSTYYENQWSRDIRDLGSVTFSRNGVPGISQGSKLRAIGFKLSWLHEYEMEQYFSLVDEVVGKTNPIYLCFDPDPTIYRQRRSFLGYLEEQASVRKIGFDRFERNYQLLSLF